MAKGAELQEASLLQKMSWLHVIGISLLLAFSVVFLGSRFGALFEYVFVAAAGAFLALQKSKMWRTYVPIVVVGGMVLAMFADPLVADRVDAAFGLNALGGARTVRDPLLSIMLNGLSAGFFIGSYILVRYLVSIKRLNETF